MHDENNPEHAYKDSLRLLHLAQSMAIKGGLPAATIFVEQAYDFWSPHLAADKEWGNYLLFTLAYFEKDLNRMESLCEKTGYNIEVAERLLSGVKAHGDFDYGRDYPATALKSSYFLLPLT